MKVRHQIDLVDMSKLPVLVNGQALKYILIVQDVFSRFLWLRALSSKVSKEVASALADLYMEVGPPKVLQADNGGEFKKAVQKLREKLAVKIVRGSPYHPQSQGKVERSHRALRKKISFDMAHLNKNGVNWAIQLKEYQKLQSEESMEALGRQSPFQVFYGRESNAVKNFAQGGRCVCESGKSSRTPTKKDFTTTAHKCSKMRNKAKVASQIWDKRYIDRRMRNNPPSTYSVGETILVRYPFSRVSKAAPKRRYVIQGKIIKRNLKLFRYKVKYEHPETHCDITSWVSVEDITSLTVAEEKKKKEVAKRKKAAARKKSLDKNSAVPSLNHMSLTTKEIYGEFENQGYKVTFNPPGNGNCQFAAVAPHLQNIGILRSPETLRDEVCKYLEGHDSAPDGMPLELFVGMPWSAYLQQMISDGTYGDQLTLQAIANLYQIQLDIISSSGEDHATHIVPQDSEPVATLALGHFSEDRGMHYVSLTETYAHHIRDETENDQDDGCGMSETNENVTDQQSGTGIREEREPEVGQSQVEILERNENDVHQNDNVSITPTRAASGESMSNVLTERMHQPSSSMGTSSEGFFEVLPDKIVDMIFKFIIFGATNRDMVNGYSSLFNVCRRFRRIVLPYRHELPRVHMRKDMDPGWHSILSLCKKLGSGSGVIQELKSIIECNRWLYAWVYLLFTGVHAWMYVRKIKWKKK